MKAEAAATDANSGDEDELSGTLGADFSIVLSYQNLLDSGIPIIHFSKACGVLNAAIWKRDGIPKKHNAICLRMIAESNAVPLDSLKLEVSDYNTLPDLMLQAKRWLVWKSIPNKDPTKKPSKVPYYASGKPRSGVWDSAEDMAQLSTFTDAEKRLKAAGYTGLGFALGADGTGNYWQGVDFDHSKDHPELAHIIDDLPSYTESSPSGGGWHVIGYGRHFEAMGSNASGIEAYSSGRYFTVTGENSGLGGVCDIADFVETLRRLHFLNGKPEQPGETKQTEKTETTGRTEQEHIDPRTVTELRSALLFLKADDRELWVRLGHALKTLGDTGRGLFMDWSATSDKFDPQDASRTWDSFKPTETDYKAIFTVAQAAGWVNPRSKSTTGGFTVDFEPEPLRAPMPKAEPYPVQALGGILGDAAQALHETIKAPLALCCQSVLAAASLAVQAHFDIALPWGEVKPMSLFLLTVAESGERKSSLDDCVLGAAKIQERQAMEAYIQDLEQYENDLAKWKATHDAGLKKSATAKLQAMNDEATAEAAGPKPQAPIQPLRFVTDPTIEGLFKLLAVGQPSVGLFSDEGGLLIGGHALNADNSLKTMARWSKFWDGAAFDRVRAVDGSSILYGRRMSMHQQAQPEVMAQLLGDRMANGQGFLARCLVAWPDSTIGTRHLVNYEWAGNRQELKRLFAVLKGLLEAPPLTGTSGQELTPCPLKLDDDAVSLAISAANQFETLMQSGNDLSETRDRASKAVEMSCRIAGNLAVIDTGLKTGSISRGHLEQGLVLMQWYLAENLRIRGAAIVPQAVIDAESLSKWLESRGLKRFRTSPILTAGPSQLRNKTRLMAALKILMANGYILKNEPGTLIDNVRSRLSWDVLCYVV